MSTQTAPHLSHPQSGTATIRSGHWSIHIAPAVRERFQNSQPLILLGALEVFAEASLHILSARAFRSENITEELIQILKGQATQSPANRLDIVGIFVPENISWDLNKVSEGNLLPVAAWLVATRDPENKTTRLSVLTRRAPTLESTADILQTLQANLEAGLRAMRAQEPTHPIGLINPSREALLAAPQRPRFGHWATALAAALVICAGAYFYFRPEDPSAPSLRLSSWRAPEASAPQPVATPPAAAIPVPIPPPPPDAESPTPRAAAKQYVTPATTSAPAARPENLEEPAPPSPVLTASNPPASTLALPVLAPPTSTPPISTPPPPSKPAVQAVPAPPPPTQLPPPQPAAAIEPAKLRQGGSVTLPPSVTRNLPAGSAVMLAITVGTDGHVQQVNATPTRGVPPFVVTQVQSAARSWTYAPARRVGQPLISIVTARVDLASR